MAPARVLLQVCAMNRTGKFAVAICLLALVPNAAARAAASADLTRLLNEYRAAESALRPSAAMPLTDRRYLDRYDDDLTTAYLDARRKINSDTRSRLSLIDRKALKGQDQLTYDILDWSLGDDASELKPGIADRFRLLPLNQFNGAQISFAREAQERDAAPFNQPRDYDNAIRRMLGFSRWLDQAIANMREGLKQGVTEPRAVVERMIAQVDTIAGGDPELSVFMRPAKNVPNRIAAADRARVVESYRAAVSGELIPAYRRLAEFLKTEFEKIPALRVR